MRRASKALLALMGAMAASADAALVYNTHFNMVSFIDGFTNDGGGMASSTGQVFMGFAELYDNDTAQTFPSFPVPPGYTEAYGRADHTELKSRVRVEDISIRRQTARSTTYDVVTISDPAVPIGTPGTFSLTFTWGGSATVLDGLGVGNPSTAFASARLHVITHVGLSLIPTVVATDTIDLGDAQSQGKIFNATVPFNYGVPLGLRFDLTTDAQNDWNCMFTASSLFCSGGTLDFVEADFANSANLRSIIIPDGATFTGTSLTDYTPLIGAVVPLPGALLLLLSALVGLEGTRSLRRR
jgi:hypothetical protein